MNARELKASLQPGVAFAKGLGVLDEALGAVMEHEARKSAVTKLIGQESTLRQSVKTLNAEVKTAGAELASLKGKRDKGLDDIRDFYAEIRRVEEKKLFDLKKSLSTEGDKLRKAHNRRLSALADEAAQAVEKTGIANDALDVARAAIGDR